MEVTEEDLVIIIKFIQVNDIPQLISFIEIKKLDLKYLINGKYDLLILALENNVSLYNIKLLIKKFYKSVNYCFQIKNNNQNLSNINYYENFKIPLFETIAKNNFNIANYLIKFTKADINYTNKFYIKNSITEINILQYLYNYNKKNCLLNKQSLKYIFNNGFSSKKAINFISNHLSNYKLLNYFFPHILFNDNNEILYFISLYKNKISLNNQQWYKVLLNKNNVFKDTTFYDIAHKDSCCDTIKVLLDYDCSPRNIFFERINKYYLYEYNIDRFGSSIIQKLLKYDNLDFTLLNFQNCLIYACQNEEVNVVKNLLYNTINHSCFKLKDIDFRKFFIDVHMNENSLDIDFYIVDLIYHHPRFDINELNLENIFLNIINSYDNTKYMEIFINKLISYQYNFSLINYSKILKSIVSYPYGDKIMDTFLNLLEKNNIYPIKNFDYKLLLIESCKVSEEINTPISKYLLKLIFNISEKNIKSINFNELKKCDSRLLNLVINLIIEMGNFELLKEILENYELKPNIDINIKDINNNYPIITAIHAATHLARPHIPENTKIFKYLLDYGADVNQKDEYSNFLFIIALYIQDYFIVNLILKKNLILDEKDINKNRDPVFSSIYNDNIDFIKKSMNKINSNFIKNEENDPKNEENDPKNFFEINYNKIFEIDNESLNSECIDDFYKNKIDELLSEKNIENSFNEYMKLFNKDINEIYSAFNIDYSSYNDNLQCNSIKFRFTPLILSYLLNKTEIFNFLVKNCNINEVDSFEYTILHYAIFKEDVKLIKYLLSKNADVNYHSNKKGRGQSAIDIAICIGNKDIFFLLIDSGKVELDQINQKNEIPLISIIKSTKLDLEEQKIWIKKLLQNGADINIIDKCECSPLSQAIKCHSLSLTKFLVEHGANIEVYDKNNNGPLTFAIFENNIPIIQYLIDCGVDLNPIDENKQNPLEVAIRWGYLSVVKILVENGADVNCVIKDYKDNDISILGYCFQVHESAIAKYLIEKGAKLDYKTSNNKSLFDIAYDQLDKDELEVMEILIKYNINGFTEKIIWNTIKNNDEDNVEFFKFLIEHGLNINIKDSNNNTLLGVAIINRNEEIVDYLLTKKNVDFYNINKQGQTIYEIALNNIDENLNQYNSNISENPYSDNIIETKNNKYEKGKSILQKLESINIENLLKNKTNSLSKKSEYEISEYETNINETNINETNINETNINETNINETNINEINVHKTNIHEIYVNETNNQEIYVNETNNQEIDEQKINEQETSKQKTNDLITENKLNNNISDKNYKYLNDKIENYYFNNNKNNTKYKTFKKEKDNKNKWYIYALLVILLSIIIYYINNFYSYSI